jgi:hypothetical protein
MCLDRACDEKVRSGVKKCAFKDLLSGEIRQFLNEPNFRLFIFAICYNTWIQHTKVGYFEQFQVFWT